MLGLVDETAQGVPAAACRLDAAPRQQHAPAVVLRQRTRGDGRVRVEEEAARSTAHHSRVVRKLTAAARTDLPVVEQRHEENDARSSRANAEDRPMSPRAAGATVHELSRIGLLATLPGETIARLAE